MIPESSEGLVATVPYDTIPYRTIPYHTIPYHTIPYHTIQCYCNVMQCNTMQCLPGKTLFAFRSSEILDVQRFVCQRSSTGYGKQGKIKTSEIDRSKQAFLCHPEPVCRLYCVLTCASGRLSRGACMGQKVVCFIVKDSSTFILLLAV